jgi:hypothetical protein
VLGVAVPDRRSRRVTLMPAPRSMPAGCSSTVPCPARPPPRRGRQAAEDRAAGGPRVAPPLPRRGVRAAGRPLLLAAAAPGSVQPARPRARNADRFAALDGGPEHHNNGPWPLRPRRSPTHQPARRVNDLLGHDVRPPPSGGPTRRARRAAARNDRLPFPAISRSECAACRQVHAVKKGSPTRPELLHNGSVTRSQGVVVNGLKRPGGLYLSSCPQHLPRLRT